MSKKGSINFNRFRQPSRRQSSARPIDQPLATFEKRYG
jgi:hypothetical protein